MAAVAVAVLLLPAAATASTLLLNEHFLWPYWCDRTF